MIPLARHVFACALYVVASMTPFSISFAASMMPISIAQAAAARRPIILLTTIPRERFGGVHTDKYGWLLAADKAAGPVWSADRTIAAYPRGDGAISIYDMRQGRTIATLQQHDVPFAGGPWHEVLAISPDGHLVAAGGYNFGSSAAANAGVLRIWKRDQSAPFRTIANVNPADLSFTPDGSTLVFRDGDAYHAVDIEHGTMTTWRQPAGWCAPGSNDDVVPETVARKRDTGLVLYLITCAYDANGNAAKSATISLWPFGGSAPVASIDATPIDVLAISPDAEAAAGVLFAPDSPDLAYARPQLKFWDLATGKARFAGPMVIDEGGDVGWRPTLLQLAVAGNVAVALLRTSSRPADGVGYVGPDEYRLGVWSVLDGHEVGITGQRTVASTEQEIADLDLHLALSGDGTRAFVTTPNGIDVWGIAR